MLEAQDCYIKHAVVDLAMWLRWVIVTLSPIMRVNKAVKTWDTDSAPWTSSVLTAFHIIMVLEWKALETLGCQLVTTLMSGSNLDNTPTIGSLVPDARFIAFSMRLIHTLVTLILIPIGIPMS